MQQWLNIAKLDWRVLHTPKFVTQAILPSPFYCSIFFEFTVCAHFIPLLIVTRSWLLNVHKVRNLWKNLLKKRLNGVKSVQTAGYNVRHMEINIKKSYFPIVHCVNLTSATSLLNVFCLVQTTLEQAKASFVKVYFRRNYSKLHWSKNMILFRVKTSFSGHFLGQFGLNLLH